MAKRRAPNTRTTKSRAAKTLDRQLLEIATVAPQVIARRSYQIAASGGAATRKNQRELSRMSTEKLAAAWQSAGAMGWYWASLPWQLGAMGMNAWLPSTTAGKPGDPWTELLSAGVEPWRRTVVANNKRLKRRSG